MAPRKRKRKSVSPPPEPTRADVDAAVLHLARLASAHAGMGVEFVAVDDSGEEEYPFDTEGLATLAAVAELLLEDRKRMRERAADALLPALHDTVTRVFQEARASEDVEEHTEDLVAERVTTVGFVLGPSQMKRFDVSSADIKKVKGARQAAADALVDGMEGRRLATRRGRSVFHAMKRRKTQPPIAGPMHRYVPLRDVRRYLDRVLAAAVDQSRPDILLPLEALGSEEHSEALLNRVETSFKERTRADLERGHEEMTGFFLALLRGEHPAPGYATTREREEQWALWSGEFRSLAAALISATGDDPEVLVQKAREAARWWMGDFKMRLDIA